MLAEDGTVPETVPETVRRRHSTFFFFIVFSVFLSARALFLALCLDDRVHACGRLRQQRQQQRRRRQQQQTCTDVACALRERAKLVV